MPAPLFASEYQHRAALFAQEHAAVTADTLARLAQIPAGMKFRVDSVQYVNPTGLAQDAANYFVIELLKGATIAASWSTQTGAQGSIAADTFVTLVKSATDADLVFAGGDVMSMNLNETGTATLPAGRLVVYGRWVQ